MSESIFIMEAPKQSIPPGQYLLRYLGMERIENAYGPAVRWTWEVAGGEHQAKRVSRITAPHPKPTNACGKIVQGLAGPVGIGTPCDVSKLVGRLYLGTVVATANGGAMVESITPAPML